MTNFCNFFKDGKVIYNNINIINNEKVDMVIGDREVINHKDIFMNKYTKQIYHKSYSFDNERYLEWKKTRKNDWDWFLCEVDFINMNDTVPIYKLYKSDNNKSDNDNPDNNNFEKNNILKIKTEIMTNSYAIMKKYDLNTEDTKILTSMIMDAIDSFEFS